MKAWIFMLSGLLVAQLVLAVAVNLTDEDYEAFQAQEKLLVFDAQAVNGLRIEDGQDSVVLNKRDGEWVLPESGDFPASAGSVDGLLDKLAGLEKGWPVATTSGAVRRFKVDDEQFERKLTLLSEQAPLAELYVGTSPGFRKVHVRPAGDDAVFAAAFNSWEANAKVDDWIDKDILKLDEAEMTRVEMPDFVLQREDDKLKLSNLGEGEAMNMEEARAFISKLAGLRIQSLLGAEANTEYQQDEPVLEVVIAQKDGDDLSYRFSKPEEASYYVLKRSDFEHYFKVAEFTVDPIKETVREKLVQAAAAEVSGEAVDGETQAAAPMEVTE